MVDVVVYLNVDERTAQQKLGWIGGKTAFYLKNAELIAKATNGKVWIKEGRYGDLTTLDRVNGYWELMDTIEDMIIEAASKAIEEGKIAENEVYRRNGTEQKVPVVDVAELYDEMKKAYEEFERKKKEEEERKNRLTEQWAAFKRSRACGLYNNYYHDYLDGKDHERYEELIEKLKNELLTDEELKAVIEELEKLYEKAKVNKELRELEELKKKNGELQKKVSELEETVELLRKFIVENLDADTLVSWLRKKKEEDAEDEAEEEARELVPELFEDDEGYDY